MTIIAYVYAKGGFITKLAAMPQDFSFARLELHDLPSPIHITDEVALEKNLKILAKVAQNTRARILLALKAFAQFSLFPLIGRYLHGATASSLFEARLAYYEAEGELTQRTACLRASLSTN